MAQPRASLPKAELPKKITTLSGRDVSMLRRARNLTQDEVARACGISTPMLSMIESGRRRMRADHEIALLRIFFQ
jgi:transcriptional regulator with XRE-family HTH domain